MKKLFLLSAVFAAGLLTSCSSDKDVDSGPDLTGKFNAEGKAYINISINTPTQSDEATRAAGITDEDGDATEYTVNDAILLIFSGATGEDGAHFCSAYDLAVGASVGNTAEITAIHKPSTAINRTNIDAGDQIYLYAILNGVKSGAFAWKDAEKTTLTVKKEGGDVDLAKTITFSTFKGYTLAAAKIGEPASGANKGMLMTNAPLSSKAGGGSSPKGATITWLSKLNEANIYASAEEALAGNATEIYVERAAAKVGVTVSAANVTGNTSLTIDATNVKWAIDNTETTFYGTRNLPETSAATEFDYKSSATGMTYRFVDDRATAANLYRIHWAQDPHYTYAAWNNAVTSGDYATIKETVPTASAIALLKASGEVDYCTENTCQWNEQTKSTRVIVAIPFNYSGGSANAFYTIPDVTGQDVIQTSLTAVGTALAEVIKSTAEYTDFCTAAKAAATAASKTYDESGVSVTVTAENQADKKTAKATAVTLTYSYDDVTHNADATLNGKALDHVKDIKVNYYSTGYAFYKVMIQHFGQADTYLDPSTTETSYTGLYGTTTDHDKNFLGRFGVVRNHWYEIDIDGVRHIGTPDVPTIPTTPDDEVNNYISCKINITKWAKHTQTGVKI